MIKLRTVVTNYYDRYKEFDVQGKDFYKNSLLDIKKSYNAIKKNKVFMTQFMKRIKTSQNYFI